jgi:hypothetical protein
MEKINYSKEIDINEIVRKFFEDHDFHYDWRVFEYDDKDIAEIIININNGDWKHDHARFMYIMDREFPIQIRTCICNHKESCSDCYSAEYIFYL